jgi:hypothetical protein
MPFAATGPVRKLRAHYVFKCGTCARTRPPVPLVGLETGGRPLPTHHLPPTITSPFLPNSRTRSTRIHSLRTLFRSGGPVFACTNSNYLLTLYAGRGDLQSDRLWVQSVGGATSHRKLTRFLDLIIIGLCLLTVRHGWR